MRTRKYLFTFSRAFDFSAFYTFQMGNLPSKMAPKGGFFAGLAQVDWPSPLKMIFSPRPLNPLIKVNFCKLLFPDKRGKVCYFCYFFVLFVTFIKC